MRHKDLFVSCVIALCIVGVVIACTVDRSNVTPTQAAELTVLKQQKATAEQSKDPVAMARADADLAAFEDRVLRERAGPIAGTLAAINPALGWLSPLILGFAPLLGKRGRQNAKAGLKSASKGQIVEAALAIPRTLGIMHTPESVKAQS